MHMKWHQWIPLNAFYPRQFIGSTDSRTTVNLKARVCHNLGSSTDRFRHRSLHAMRRGCKKVTKFGLVFKNSHAEWLFVYVVKIWREGVRKFEPCACEDENRQQDMERQKIWGGRQWVMEESIERKNDVFNLMNRSASSVDRYSGRYKRSSEKCCDAPQFGEVDHLGQTI